MAEIPERMIFGYPEMGEKVHKEYEPAFKVLFRLNDALNGIINAAYDKPTIPQKVILVLGNLSMISMLELMTLVGNGLGQGAFKILRSMLEYGINAEYLRSKPTEVEDFIAWHSIEHYKNLIYMKDNMPDAYEKLSPEAVKKTEEAYASAKPRFEYITSSGKVNMRNTWCKLDLGARAVAIGFHEEYKLINPLASKLLHGSLSGMAMHYQPDEDPHRLAVPPSLKWCSDSLIGGHLSALKMAQTLARTFNKDTSPPFAELEADYRTAWQELNARRSLPA